MPSILDQAQQVAKEAAQFAGCTLDAAFSFGSRILSGIDPPSLFPLLCPDEIPPPGLFPTPPFTGGQCVGVFYNILYTSFGTPRSIGGFRGPVDVRVTDVAPVGSRLEYRFTPSGDGPFSDWVAVGEFADPDFTFDGVQRVDGLPDDCGNPPPLPPPNPPLPIPPPEDRPVTDPDGGPDINFTFAPTFAPIFVDVDGSLKIPVNVEVSGPLFSVPLNIPVNISLPDFSPTINIGGRTGKPGPPSAPCCDPPNIPGEQEDGEEDQPIVTKPTPEGAILHGVRVFSVVNRERAMATELNTGPDIPPLWVPRLASVYFELRAEDENGDAIITFSKDEDVKLTDQLVLAPPGVIARRAFVRPALGVRSSARPLFKQGR